MTARYSKLASNTHNHTSLWPHVSNITPWPTLDGHMHAGSQLQRRMQFYYIIHIVLQGFHLIQVLQFQWMSRFLSILPTDLITAKFFVQETQYYSQWLEDKNMTIFLFNFACIAIIMYRTWYQSPRAALPHVQVSNHLASNCMIAML